MVRVKDPGTGKRVQAQPETVRKAAVAAAELKDSKPKGQANLSFCATCGHAEKEQHPNGPCIAEWEVGEEKAKRFCSCREFWPERKQREEGYAVTGWNVRLTGSHPVMHKTRAETEFWEALRTGGQVRILVVASVGPKGFKPVKDHGVTVSVEENRPLHLERIEIIDGETGELL